MGEFVQSAGKRASDVAFIWQPSLDLGRGKNSRRPVDGGSTTRVLHHALAEISAHRNYPAAVREAHDDSADGHGMVESPPIPADGHQIAVSKSEHPCRGPRPDQRRENSRRGCNRVLSSERMRRPPQCRRTGRGERRRLAMSRTLPEAALSARAAWMLARSRCNSLRMTPALGRRVTAPRQRVAQKRR